MTRRAGFTVKVWPKDAPDEVVFNHLDDQAEGLALAIVRWGERSELPPKQLFCVQTLVSVEVIDAGGLARHHTEHQALITGANMRDYLEVIAGLLSQGEQQVEQQVERQVERQDGP